MREIFASFIGCSLALIVVAISGTIYLRGKARVLMKAVPTVKDESILDAFDPDKEPCQCEACQERRKTWPDFKLSGPNG